MMDVCDMYVFLRICACIAVRTSKDQARAVDAERDRVKPGAIGLMRVSECTLRRLDR